MRASSITAAIIAAGLLVATPCLAQSGDARAESLIDEGVALRRTGDDVGALARFEAAFALSRSARARAQIALVEQALGRWIDAEAHLLEALGSHEPWIEERRATLEGQLEVIRSHLGRVQLVGGPAGARVSLDDQPRGSLPITSALLVEPGAVVVEVRAPGYLLFQRTIETTEGQLTTLQIELVQEPSQGRTPSPAEADTVAVAPAPTEPADDDGPPFEVLGWSGIGLGVASLAMSAVSLALRNGEAETFNSAECLAGGRSRAENCRSNYDATMMWEQVSIATLIVGLALGGAGAALVIVGASEGSNELTLACVPTAGTVSGLACHGRF